MRKLTVISVTVWCVLGCWRAPAQTITNLINYQGKLVSGTNLGNGLVPKTCRLYNMPVGGAMSFCTDTGMVPVGDGLYSTFIGDNVVQGSFDNALMQTQVWIEVAIDGTNILAPREQLVTVAFSRFAGGLTAGALQSHMIADNQIYGFHMVNGAITGPQLANFAVSNSHLAFNAVSTSVIADGNVTGAKIQNGAITSDKVATNTFWQTRGNAGTTPGAHFVGTTDNQPLDLYANSQRVFRLSGEYTSPNIIGGQSGNLVNPLAVGGTISGGGG